MKTPDTERIAQACRTYGALLRAYPASFRREYGDTLFQHFRDEYRHALASSRHSSLLRFWVFILLDFIPSLMREYQEEVIEMVKKHFYVYSAVAAGLGVPLWYFLTGAPHTWKAYFLAESGYFLFFALGFLALFAVLNATRSHLLFQSLPLLLAGASFVFLPVPRPHSFLGKYRLLGIFLGLKEANMVSIAMISYFILITLTGILMLVKRKWLPGVILVLMAGLPTGITAMATIIPSFGETEDEWFVMPIFFLFMAGWFVVAWWLRKERVEISQPGTLEAA